MSSTTDLAAYRAARAKAGARSVPPRDPRSPATRAQVVVRVNTEAVAQSRMAA